MDEDSRVVVIVTSATGVVQQIATEGSPTAVVAAGVAPVVIETCRRAWSALRGRQAERVGELIAAAEILDPGLGILNARGSDYDARLELLNRVLEAAARSTLSQVRQLAARVEELSQKLAGMEQLLADLDATAGPHIYGQPTSI